MNCPKCNSDNTQTLPVIYESGTSDEQTTSHTHGGGFFSLTPSFRAKSTATSTSQSIAAQNASPPAKKKLRGLVVITVASAAYGLSTFSSGFNLGQLIVGLAVAGGFGYLAFSRFQHNSKVWPGHFQAWQASWKCHKCGTVFQQS